MQISQDHQGYQGPQSVWSQGSHSKLDWVLQFLALLPTAMFQQD